MQRSPIEVIAIEYPPLFGENLENGGTILAALQSYANDHFKSDIKPHFMPPARAKQRVESYNWCLTVYPPVTPSSETYFVALLDDPIKIGLYRKSSKAAREEFIWDDLRDLRGARIAVLRTNTEGPFKEMLDAAGIEPVYVETTYQGLQLLLHDRVDYTQGDVRSAESLPEDDAKQLEFSKSSIAEFPVGFHYHRDCADRIFKAGHIPHLVTEAGEETVTQ